MMTLQPIGEGVLVISYGYAIKRVSCCITVSEAHNSWQTIYILESSLKDYHKLNSVLQTNRYNRCVNLGEEGKVFSVVRIDMYVPIGSHEVKCELSEYSREQ